METQGKIGCKSRPSWEEPLDENLILDEVAEMVAKNISYGREAVFGFPGTKPALIGVFVHNKYLHEHANNIGMHTNKKDGESEIGFSGTQEAERQVIAMAADLMGADAEEVDGYISSGGTEANITGCWIGRNACPEKPTALLCSCLSHYSVFKAADLLGIGTQPKSDGSGLHWLGADQNGHILLSELRERAVSLIKSGIQNIVIIANAGTTMLGSVDNIPAINEIIEKMKREYEWVNFHLHVDAAFGGFIAPFIEGIPPIGFENSHVDTLTMDVHKMGRAAYGSGIILARHGLLQKRISSIAPYVPGGDCTLIGSRSGTMALSCWATMRSFGKKGYKRNALQLMDTASRIKKLLRDSHIEMFANDLNIIAVKSSFPDHLRQEFLTHVQSDFPCDLSNPFGPKTTVWNIVVMDHTKTGHIDDYISRLGC